MVDRVLAGRGLDIFGQPRRIGFHGWMTAPFGGAMCSCDPGQKSTMCGSHCDEVCMLAGKKDSLMQGRKEQLAIPCMSRPRRAIGTADVIVRSPMGRDTSDDRTAQIASEGTG